MTAPIYDGHPPYRGRSRCGWLLLAGMILAGLAVLVGRVW